MFPIDSMKVQREVMVVFFIICIVCKGEASFVIDSFALRSVSLESWSANVTEISAGPVSKVGCASHCLRKTLQACNAFTYDKDEGCSLAKLDFVLVPEEDPLAVVSSSTCI